MLSYNCNACNNRYQISLQVDVIDLYVFIITSDETERRTKVAICFW